VGEVVGDVALNDGRAMPQVGLGVYKVEPALTEAVVAEAIAAGYRSVDTAALYGNEAEVGRAVRQADVERGDLFVTTKLWNDAHRRDQALRAFDASLERLGLDYVDLYLIHWPCPSQDRYVEAFRTLVELRDEGRARSIGVSNFQPAHLRRIVDETGVVPVVNQVELHPYFPQVELRAFHHEHGIATEAWRPLGGANGVLDEPVVGEIAGRHGVSPAQVVLRWHVEQGSIVIPKSVHAERIRRNLDLFSFELADDDRAQLDGLDRGQRDGPDPDRM
jgi:diketogulonate reductase-like aldo/keto reductase